MLWLKKGDPLSQNKYINNKYLVDKPLICSRQVLDTTLDKNDFAEWFGTQFDDLNIVSTFNLAYNAGWMVKAGLGYAITLDSIIDTSTESELTFIPLKPKLVSKHNLVWRKDHTFSKAAQLFLDKTKATCQ